MSYYYTHMENELHNIVIDHLCDPENKEKQAAVAAWLDASEENRLLFTQVKEVWEASNGLPLVAFDKKGGWETLSDQLNIQGAQTPVRRITARSMWWRAAAVVLPLVLVGAYFTLHYHQQSWTNYVAKGNAIDSLTLPDGSAVYLQAGSQLSYNNDHTQRQVKLQKGEAFFKIAKDGQHPFSIQVPDATIKVLGTSFNVSTTNTYSDVAVWDGKVSVSGAGDQPPVTLTAGDLAIIKNKEVSKPAGNYAYRCGWSNKDLAFNDQEVAVVMQTLEAFYHVHLNVQDKKLLKNKITIRFNNVPLPEALLVMSEMLDLKTRQVSDTDYVFTNNK